MAKLSIGSFEPYVMDHARSVPVFRVRVKLQSDAGESLETTVKVAYEYGQWRYMYSDDPVFDELDCKWGYGPSNQVESFAASVIQKSECFIGWPSIYDDDASCIADDKHDEERDFYLVHNKDEQ